MKHFNNFNISTFHTCAIILVKPFIQSQCLVVELVIRYSVLAGSTYNGVWDGWYGPSGREWIYNVGGVISSEAGRAIASIGYGITAETVRTLRENAMIKCPPKNDSLPLCKPLQEPCLFNVYQDPCEDNNLVKQ